MALKITDEQRDIREAGATLPEGDHMKVVAFAGAGKTSTLKETAAAIPKSGLYLAFNKAIADEARRKFAATRCSASTMHGLAYGVMRDFIGTPAQMNARTFRESGISDRFFVPKVKGWNEYRVASAVARALSVFCNSDAAVFGVDHGREALIASVGDPDMIRNKERGEEAAHVIDRLSPVVTEMAAAWWKASAREGRFSHDMYLKALDLDEGLRREAFRGRRYLMVDEAQDQNAVQLSILRKTGISIIAVGDPYQQIYSWRGAENALDKLPGRTFWLTRSFRFREDIAALARSILATRPDGGPEKRLIGAGSGDISGHKGAAAAIICRTNLGMIDEALNLARKGISFHVDNMEGLLADVRSAQALYEGRMRDVVSQDIKVFGSWSELEIEASEGDGALSRLVGLVEGNRVPEIEGLGRRQTASPADAKVMVCTAHRSKGLEWPAVQLGRDWKDLGEMQARWEGSRKMSAKHQVVAMEEWNALYVASTRAMIRLKGLSHDFLPKAPRAAAAEGAPAPT
jgi:F-box protein, helicase, 18